MNILIRSSAVARTWLMPALLAGGIITPAVSAEKFTMESPADSGAVWTASWQASPQPVWGKDFLFPTQVPAVLKDQTIRQLARISLGGRRMRIVLSNAYGQAPITLGKATVGLTQTGLNRAEIVNAPATSNPSADNRAPIIAGTPLARLPGQDDKLNINSLQIVTFGGQSSVTILPGAAVISDPIALRSSPLAQVAVSLYLPVATPVSTFHWDGRQTGWIVPGNRTAAAEWVATSSQSITARLLLTGIEVEAPPSSSALVVMGDSITDGAAASLDKDRRWPDFLAERLAPYNVAVVNAGISGARLLADGMGANALTRLDRDVLAQPGVKSAILMLGINDITWPGTAFAPHSPRPTLSALIAGYQQWVSQAHRRGVRAIGATLTPFKGALPGTPLADYFHPDKDRLRRQLNEWIRHSGVFDGVIDFDALLQDSTDPASLSARFDSGDRLHPGDEGNRAMAYAVSLTLLLPDLQDQADAKRNAVSGDH
ncbi:SGNH/GDSL hydrolase family protein [Biostraticola tofi]|uniref:Lysophospholipase L1-like esterase n=1 Tax=Biostraticola tofi TaxID=466109 RepID=A0A4R3YV40_9GAMM|nr:SGNH/GDSL hydrolase family protein [Biostraticola tofi]TCV95073.1 lysophospholipase L1-like esterase [Biostraticola tofi]